MQLAVSFPLLGLSVAGVAVRLFRIFSREQLAEWKRAKELRRAHRRRVAAAWLWAAVAVAVGFGAWRRERKLARKARWAARRDRLRHGAEDVLSALRDAALALGRALRDLAAKLKRRSRG